MLTRRGFSAAALLAAASPGLQAQGRARLSLGIIGTGLRCQVLLRELLQRNDVDIAAL